MRQRQSTHRTPRHVLPSSPRSVDCVGVRKGVDDDALDGKASYLHGGMTSREPAESRRLMLIASATRAIQQTSRATAVVAASLIFALLLVFLADIILRSLLNQPIPGVFEYTEVVLVVVVFLGVPYAMQTGAHVAIDSVANRLPGRWAPVAEAVGLAAPLLVVIWMALASIGVAIDSIVSNEVQFGVVKAQIWPARVAIALGSWLLAAEMAVTIQRVLSRQARPESEGV